MKVLLSIKPEFADKIFTGEKKYEFRRSIFKSKEVRTVIVYASSPIKKVIGEFEIEEVICEGVQDLWHKTKLASGITFEKFASYFEHKQHGYAIKIKTFLRYSEPLCIRKDFNIHPPQFFVYLPS